MHKYTTAHQLSKYLNDEIEKSWLNRFEVSRISGIPVATLHRMLKGKTDSIKNVYKIIHTLMKYTEAEKVWVLIEYDPQDKNKE